MVNQRSERVIYLPNITKFTLQVEASVEDMVSVIFLDNPYRGSDGNTFKNFFDWL